MARGGINHIALTVSDLERSSAFTRRYLRSSDSNASKFRNPVSRR